MNFRDIELLSAYLDGQVSPSDSARLEARLKSDPEMGLALQSLRESRGLLRQLPHRRAPRNFTLTRAMVGLKPPLPRVYPVFRFATALAAILFVFSFTTNQVSQLAASAPVPAFGLGGSGGGGGGDGSGFATEVPMLEMAPAATEPAVAAPTMEAAVLDPAADSNRVATEESTAQKNGDEATLPTRAHFMFSSAWLMGLALVIVIGVAGMFLLPTLAARKWRAK